VKEESQLEDMRAALRGERAEARRLSTENVRALVEPPANAPAAPPPRRRRLLHRLLGR
jgi:hypothetical protein